MKVFFISTLQGRYKGYDKNYRLIYKTIEELGHENLSNWVLVKKREEIFKETPEETHQFYKNILKNISLADAVVLEVSIPSTDGGHVQRLVLDFEKPLIALYTEGNEPYLLRGIESKKLVKFSYNFSNLKEVLEYAFEEAERMIDTRFTILFPPKIINFLNKISRKKGIPRSVYIRDLIEKEMEKEKEVIHI